MQATMSLLLLIGIDNHLLAMAKSKSAKDITANQQYRLMLPTTGEVFSFSVHVMNSKLDYSPAVYINPIYVQGKSFFSYGNKMGRIINNLTTRFSYYFNRYYSILGEGDVISQKTFLGYLNVILSQYVREELRKHHSESLMLIDNNNCIM